MDILQYVNKIWSIAEYFRGAGIKQSEWPGLMMPFFALRLVESRLIREKNKIEEEIGGVTKENIDDFVEYFKTKSNGYNAYVIKENKCLYTICMNDTTIETDFVNYLRAYDDETKNLLGVDKTNPKEDKFLGISNVEGILKGKNILFPVLKLWSEIDLTPFNNSEITTLEEHIKRKWADISAETAGEQYTPDDIISLITDIVSARVDNDSKDYLRIYDPTCGGGNLLFGVEDKLKHQTTRPMKTYGMEWESSLYALAKIESRFRDDSEIRYGNTLTTVPFINERFDVVIANPPYGVDWKGYKKEIDNDQTGQFVDTPAVSDGQLLFDQHIAYHLANNGIAVIVNNGSSLFSGDAGSGESNIRKYFFDQDWVEAIVQMPTQEFFNTGIYTYLWILNKNKSDDRKDKVMLIDGSNFWQPLKKSKGDKRREMSEDNRKTIIDAFVKGEESDYCRVFSKYFFYYNKQKIVLNNVDIHYDKNQSEEEKRKHYVAEPIKLSVKKIQLGNIVLDKDVYTVEEYAKASHGIIWYANTKCIVIDTNDDVYLYDEEQESILKNGKPIGCGKMDIKVAEKKPTKKIPYKQIVLSAQIVPITENDYEITSYSPDEEENGKIIADFMAKYVSRPFTYKDCVAGVEINFNKIFYQPEVLPKASELLKEIQQIDKGLDALESEFNLNMD